MQTIKEYKDKIIDLKHKKQEFDEFLNKLQLVKQSFETAKKLRLVEFMEGFNEINLKLKEMYRVRFLYISILLYIIQLLTHGGDAELELVDTTDPFSEGISFTVRPFKKSWKQIVNLSGGEKTLSSLSLIFALHYYKPSPLYVMDEIDAALDFKNVATIATHIKERTKNSQFIIISLRNQMFDLANRLIGIYKTFDITKTIYYDNNVDNYNNSINELKSNSVIKSANKSLVKQV